MANEITFGKLDGGDNFSPSLKAIAKHIKAWFDDHSWGRGFLKLLSGAALLVYGVKSGAIEASWELLLAQFSDRQPLNVLGGTLGGIVGSMPGLIIGSIGIVGGGAALGVPGLVLAAVGALLFYLVGRGLADLLQQLLAPLPSLTQGLSGFGLFSLGMWLLYDGAQTVLGDPQVQRFIARLG